MSETSKKLHGGLKAILFSGGGVVGGAAADGLVSTIPNVPAVAGAVVFVVIAGLGILVGLMELGKEYLTPS